MDLIDEQPQLVIRREDCTADWHLVAAAEAIGRYLEEIHSVGTALESHVRETAAA